MKNRIIALVAAAILLLGCISCRKTTAPYIPSYEVVWEKTYGGALADWGLSVRGTSDGGYIAAGISRSFGSGDDDVYLIRTNSNGDTVWTRTHGGIRDDVGNSVQETDDGGYIIAGYTYSFGAGDYDVYVIRTDNNGDTIWTKTYGGNSTDKGKEVQRTSDGNYIIIGETKSFGSPFYSDVYIIKIDDDGNIVWEKTYGGDGRDFGCSIAISGNGSILIAGYSNSFGNGDIDVYLLKLDENGDTLWTKTYGRNDADFGYAVQETYRGEYVIAGGTYSSSKGEMDFYVIKTDQNGDTLWTKLFGGPHDDICYSVIETARKNYFLAGTTLSSGSGYDDIFLIETDENGNSIWEETFGGAGVDGCNSIQETSDGGCIMAGSTSSYGAGGDVYLIKIR